MVINKESVIKAYEAARRQGAECIMKTLEAIFGKEMFEKTGVNFNSTKVQFGAVKLDRKYHINKGFEKRFR